MPKVEPYSPDPQTKLHITPEILALLKQRPVEALLSPTPKLVRTETSSFPNLSFAMYAIKKTH